MCVIFLAWQADPRWPLVAAANRDEFHGRPTEAARWRDDIFCGLDLRAGGTWLGIHRSGRFAAVTNFRDGDVAPAPRSRGDLPLSFLQGTASPQAYAEQVARDGDQYGGFNLLVGDRDSLWHLNNRGAAPQPLAPGIHGLCNGQLDEPWPKVVRGTQALTQVLAEGGDAQALAALLQDRHQPDDAALPATGVALEVERMVAPIFINAPHYGTRASSLVWLPAAGSPQMVEQRWDAAGAALGSSDSRH